jgi:RecA-family ATPase
MLEPEEHISWLLADKLPASGLSVLSVKPKVGKSTFARCISLAVATGEPFLDCRTTKGPVIYLALEEKRSEVRRDFVDLGATGEEEIYIHAASAPQEAVLELCQLTKQIHPVLIVIDPLFKFVRIRDEKAYAEVCNASARIGVNQALREKTRYSLGECWAIVTRCLRIQSKH